MKICSKCHLEKPEADFFFKVRKTGKLQAQCKQCYKEYRHTYQAEHYEKFRDAYIYRAKINNSKLREKFRISLQQYMTNKSCVQCGESDPVVLEFDHLIPETKSFNISQAPRINKSWPRVLEEIEKCQILCANCHKRRTAQQFNWYKSS